MKKILSLLLLLVTFQAFGQFSNYTNINGRYKWIAGKFDSTFTLPSGSTPSLRTGGGTGPGAMFYRTTDSTIYQYTGTQWIKLRGSISPSDTAGLWMTNVYRKPGSDSVFYVKGGTHTFAFRDSIGVGGGGGGGKIYYLNGGDSLGVFGGFTMYELGDTANTGAAANFTRSTTGNLANFITDPGRPGLLQIPAGVWTVDAYLSETGGGSNHAEIWIEVEKWDGSTITTIATSPIEQITNGSAIDLYTWSVSIPTTTLAVTDRIIIQFYITNTNGKTVTLYTQNGYVGEVHTTFTTGLGSLNGLTAASQYFATGTSGTDFAISSSTATHTFNLPTASATNRGALSSADWTTFNGKVGGSGTTNYVPKFTASGTIGNSQIFDDGTNIGVNSTTPYSVTNYKSVTVNGTNGGIFATQVNGTNAFNISTSSASTYIVETRALPIQIGTNNTEKVRILSNGNVGIGTVTPVSLLEINGANAALTLNNAVASTTNLGIASSGGSYSTDANAGDFIIRANSKRILLNTDGTSAALIMHTTKNITVGSNTDAGYKLDVNGTTRISGTELRLDNGTTGVINLYSATPVIQFSAGTGDGYSIGRSSTNMNLKSNGAIVLQIGGNQAYTLDASNGHILRTGLSGGAGLARLDTGGSLSIGKGTAAAVASSILELSSTTKGFLPPRMTNAQMVAIATPATGLVVYDTTNNKLNVYDGTNWVAVH